MDQLILPNFEVLWWLTPLAALALWLTFRSRSDLSWTARVALFVIRLVMFAAVLFALARPQVEQKRVETPRAHTVILRDVSDSVRADTAHVDQLANELAGALSGRSSLLRYNFAGQVATGLEMPRDTLQTDIESALDAVYRDTMDAPASNVVLLSDGQETRGLAERAARRIALRGGAVHVVPVGLAQDSPPRLLRIDTDIQNHVGVPIIFTVTLESAKSQRVEVRLLDSKGHVLDQRQAQVQGKRSVLLQMTPHDAGLNQCQVELRTAPAQEAGGYSVLADTERAAVHVEGPPRILVLDPFPDELKMLRSALKPLQTEIDVGTPEEFPKDLAGYAAVVLSDLSGNELADDQRGMLKHFVEGGGGLLFIGGGNSVAERWMNNPVASLLPFEIESKKRPEDKPKPKVSVCYVLDRSGSMNAPLGAGISKMDMVKASVQASLRDLPKGALVTVIVFDDTSNIIVPPTSVDQKEQIANLIDQITIGGGTSMSPAIGEGIDRLRTFDGDRYLVVLTDGQSTPPTNGSWDSLVREAALNNVHWTSIAVGSDAAQDLLRTMANGAGGNYFFCDRSEKIPKVFIAQARDVRRRNDTKTEPFVPQPGPASGQLKGIDVAGVPALNDAIQTTVRAGSDVILLGRGRAPLLASWRFGLGTVIAFSSDAKPMWATKWSTWDGAPVFWSQLVQRCLRPPSKFRAKVATYDSGDAARVVFTVTDDAGSPVDALVPEGQLTPAAGSSSAPAAETLRFTSPEPGKYETRIELPEGAASRLLMAHLRDRQGGEVPYAAVIKGRRALESSATGPDTQALRALAEVGAGVYSSEASAIAAACKPPQPHEIRSLYPLWPHAIALAVALWLVDMGIRKFGKGE